MAWVCGSHNFLSSLQYHSFYKPIKMKLYPFYLKSVAKAAKYDLELRLPFLDGVWYCTTATPYSLLKSSAWQIGVLTFHFYLWQWKAYCVLSCDNSAMLASSLWMFFWSPNLFDRNSKRGKMLTGDTIYRLHKESRS